MNIESPNVISAIDKEVVIDISQSIKNETVFKVLLWLGLFVMSQVSINIIFAKFIGSGLPLAEFICPYP